MKKTNSSNLQHEVLPDEDNLELIEKEKIQYDALSEWAKKPRYQMPETIKVCRAGLPDVIVSNISLKL